VPEYSGSFGSDVILGNFTAGTETSWYRRAGWRGEASINSPKRRRRIPCSQPQAPAGWDRWWFARRRSGFGHESAVWGAVILAYSSNSCVADFTWRDAGYIRHQVSQCMMDTTHQLQIFCPFGEMGTKCSRVRVFANGIRHTDAIWSAMQFGVAAYWISGFVVRCMCISSTGRLQGADRTSGGCNFQSCPLQINLTFHRQ